PSPRLRREPRDPTGARPALVVRLRADGGVPGAGLARVQRVDRLVAVVAGRHAAGGVVGAAPLPPAGRGAAAGPAPAPAASAGAGPGPAWPPSPGGGPPRGGLTAGRSGLTIGRPGRGAGCASFRGCPKFPE